MTPGRQHVLDAVRDSIENGMSPSFAEIGRACGLTAAGAGYWINRLIQDGELRRSSRGKRSLALPDRPDLSGVETSVILAELARRGKSFDGLSGRPATVMSRGAVYCAADCCQIPVRRGHLFCRDHWFALPSELRDRLLATFGAKDAEGYEMAVTEARDRLDGSFFKRRDAEAR